MSPLFRQEGRRERGRFVSKEREYNGKVKSALRQVRREFRQLKPPIVGDQFTGSPHVDPKYLTIYLFFKDDYALAQAEGLGHFDTLRAAVLRALREECYPQESVNEVKVEFASRKAVRSSGGIWNIFR